ncbi:hypothetical protein MANES_11G124250v8 [Manihot esculenta]|uniref:Uncharacterized protein n=1 Tax=Manihot esculenta TaxID=3983 RepID=A0ACB7GWM4_MANES|nr:hypothetical protein MANES_11G124250v8 [Manihot esculenta]
MGEQKLRFKGSWICLEMRYGRFSKTSRCMALSKKKVKGIMDFLVYKMGWQSAVVARVPLVVGFSLERRIMPRYSVVRVLLLNGLIKADISLSSVLMPAEKLFLERFRRLCPSLFFKMNS